MQQGHLTLGICLSHHHQLDEIIDKAFAGDFWTVLDFSPSVLLVDTRCHASEQVLLQKMLNIISQIIKTVCPFGWKF